MENDKNTPSQSTSTGLALIGGLGITLLIVAAGIGVTTTDDSSTGLISMAAVAGGLLLIAAIIGWFGMVQPHKHFDDINQPLYTGHHHEEDSDH